jgi:calcineurin-like phosphoesterase family protein
VRLLLALLALAVAPAGHATVWAVGDGANGSTASKQVAAMIARDDPARFLYLGDVYANGSAADFRHAYDPVYGRLAARTAPTPGNHDWGLRSQGYFPYWKRKLGHALPPWYAFDLGGWQILSLDSEAAHGPGSAQLAWLHRQVTAPGTCRLAFWHRPRYSAGRVHGDAPDMAPLWDALEGHAALVVNGHEHDLQRFAPRGGLVEVVAGAGGNGHYALKRGVRGLVFGDATHYGAARIDLGPGSAHITLVATGGKQLDTLDVPCSPG